jgi:prevent-host-death family protein
MHKDLPITEARNQLTSMPESLEKEPGAIAVTRNGKPVLAILPWELYESLEETIDIMSDPALMREARRGIADFKAKRLIPWSKIKRELEL